MLSLLLVAVVAVLAVFLLGGEGGAPLGEEGQAPQTGMEGESQTVDEEPADDETILDHPSLGEAGAPVVMVEYSDYQ